jgi:hypothetical protein
MRRVGVIACGALALHVKAIARRRGWPVDVHPLPPELHNRPERIAPAVAELADELDGEYDRVVVAYADCGSMAPSTGSVSTGSRASTATTSSPGTTCGRRWRRSRARTS